MSQPAMSLSANLLKGVLGLIRLVFWDSISLCSPGWPLTHSDLPASVSQGLNSELVPSNSASRFYVSVHAYVCVCVHVYVCVRKRTHSLYFESACPSYWISYSFLTKKNIWYSFWVLLLTFWRIKKNYKVGAYMLGSWREQRLNTC